METVKSTSTPGGFHSLPGARQQGRVSRNGQDRDVATAWLGDLTLPLGFAGDNLGHDLLARGRVLGINKLHRRSQCIEIVLHVFGVRGQ